MDQKLEGTELKAVRSYRTYYYKQCEYLRHRISIHCILDTLLLSRTMCMIYHVPITQEKLTKGRCNHRQSHIFSYFTSTLFCLILQTWKLCQVLDTLSTLRSQISLVPTNWIMMIFSFSTKLTVTLCHCAVTLLCRNWSKVR